MRSFLRLLLPTALIFAAGSYHRDWQLHPAIAQSDSGEDIYVVGDVHADERRLLKVLSAAGVIQNDRAGWNAGRSNLVFTGDLIDKGPQALAVLGRVALLRREAQAAGGEVFSLMGNHEAEFLAYPAQEKSREFAGQLRADGIAPADVAACRGEAGELLCGEPFGLRIGQWFFSHAGNTQGRSITALSLDLEAGVDKNGFSSRQLIGADSLLEARLGEKGEGGRPWVEQGPKHDARALLQSYTAALGVKHIVQGHQHAAIAFADGVRRKKGQMFQRDGMLFLVDTGMSEGVGDSEGAVLLIRQRSEEAIAICADGSRTRLWDAKTAPAVGASPVCGRSKQ